MLRAKRLTKHKVEPGKWLSSNLQIMNQSQMVKPESSLNVGRLLQMLVWGIFYQKQTEPYLIKLMWCWEWHMWHYWRENTVDSVFLFWILKSEATMSIGKSRYTDAGTKQEGESTIWFKKVPSWF